MIAPGHLVAAATMVLGAAGVGIDPAAIVATVDAGARADIGQVEVRNPGAEPTSYRMFAQPGPEGLEVKAEWFGFEPSTFDLEPGRSQVVDVSVALPRGIRRGEYGALLTAAVVAADDGGTARISGAVATTAQLTVRSGSGGPPLWLLGGLALTLAVVVGVVVARARHRVDVPSTDTSGP